MIRTILLSCILSGLALTGIRAQEGSEKPLQTREPSYIMETARPVSKINAVYPYDIQLKESDGQLTSSEKVLPTNGKPTILLFWLTTCFPCRMELEALRKAVPGWRQETDFNMVAISTDFAKNFPAFVERVETGEWPWPAYNDVNREFGRILPGQLNGLPQTFVIDATGEIVYHHRKYRPGDEVALYEAVKQAAGQ